MPISEKQTALITGSSGGIGLELARCFAKHNHNVVLAARASSAIEKAAAELSTQFGVGAVPIACDLSTPDGVDKFIAKVTGCNLTIDILVNNAGYGLAGALATSDPRKQLNMIDLNIRALTELTLAYWPGIMDRRRGGVLNVASMAALMPSPFMAAYGGSKAYVLSFSQALWEEARGTGVHVTCLCPGATESNFHQRSGTENLPSGQTPMMSAKKVAGLGYRAFRNNRRVEIPGVGNKLIAGVTRFVPNRFLLRGLRHFFEAPGE